MDSTGRVSTDTSPSLRMSIAANDILEASGTQRALGYIETSSAEIVETFTRPQPVAWLRTEAAGQNEDTAGWTETTDESCRTGLVRTYSREQITGARTSGEALKGLRFTHKDNIGVSGFPLTAGNPTLSGRRSKATSPLLTAIEASGGAIVGCNHMAEFAMSPTGHNQWLGDGVNPLNEGYMSGGSSSGSAIAVASGACDVSLGTDTGGSVRLPAAFCGVVGYKPTNGVFSSAGLLPLSESLDTIGIIGKEPELVRRTMCVLFDDPLVVDEDTRAKLDNGTELDNSSMAHLPIDEVAAFCEPAVVEAYAAAMRAVEPAAAAGTNRSEAELNRSSVVVVSVEAARNVGRVLGWDWDKVGDQVLSRIIRGTAVSAIEYADSLAQRHAARRRYLNEVFRGARFLLTPASPIMAPKRSAGSDLAGRHSRNDYMRASKLTRITNYLGLPAVTIPSTESEDSLLPGLQIVGRPFDDRALLDIADALTGSH